MLFNLDHNKQDVEILFLKNADNVQTAIMAKTLLTIYKSFVRSNSY